MNPLAEAALMLLPGLGCLAIAAGLLVRAQRRASAPPQMAGRLGNLGIALLALVPGLRFMLDVAGGPATWPVMVAAIAEVGLGIALLDAVRRSWRHRGSGVRTAASRATARAIGSPNGRSSSP